jgi:hypothetical protein
VNPHSEETGLPQLGKTLMVKGPKSFFLKPGESLDASSVQEQVTLGVTEGLWLEARQGMGGKGGKGKATEESGSRRLARD